MTLLDLFIIFALVRVVVVISHAFRFGDLSMPDDTCLQVRDDRIDLVGGERARRRVFTHPLRASGSGTGTFHEGRHFGPGASAAAGDSSRSLSPFAKAP